MRVSRIGLTPLKGARHTTRPAVELTPEGPSGDRVFALVDRTRGRVLRTVEQPTLVQTVADWDGEVLRVDLPHRSVAGRPASTGEQLEVDYWGRRVVLDVVDGPWAAAYAQHLSQHLGRHLDQPQDLVLARAPRAGDVVYGGSVSLVTTSSLRRLADEAGGVPDQRFATRFRATLSVDTGDAPAHVEDGWVGRRLRVGDAELAVRSHLPRCAVVDLEPVSGVADLPVLKALGRYRRAAGEIRFAVDAVVTRAGRVETGSGVDVVEGG